MDITFFGEADLNPKGKISSEYPGWYNDTQIQDLKEQITVEENAISKGWVSKDQLGEAQDRLNQKKERLDRILESKPKMDGASKDKVDKVRNELGKTIAEGMYSRSDMMRGLADPHEEMRRMTRKGITLSPEQASFAKACGVPMEGRNVSRTGAEKVWKILSKSLGEPANIERLRRD